MRKLIMGCAMAGVMVMSPLSEASPGVLRGPQFAKLHLPMVQVGMASWYGIERHGQPTASGELFDESKLTGAHRRLPFGTRVRVTNLKNRRSTVLTINDRGPGPINRIIDVSAAAAKKLGFVNAGLVRVEVYVLSYPIMCAASKTPAGDTDTPKLN